MVEEKTGQVDSIGRMLQVPVALDIRSAVKEKLMPLQPQNAVDLTSHFYCPEEVSQK